ncbi:hypothetical protein AAHN97_17975 [Chitinophaga niabensis]|uniref:hypothetical protein n=1 Tax=Chitinophaga niabensis TaxID=536979 RepID=UPI0031BB56D8
MKQKLLSLAMLLVMLSCKKEKVDHEQDNRAVTDAHKNSGVRLVNVGGYQQVIINNDTLTNYKIIPPDPQYNQYEYPATKYFTLDGRLGRTWYVPATFIKRDGTALIKTENVSQQSFHRQLEFSILEEYNKPMDYYLLRGTDEPNIIDAPPSLMAIPRDVTAPSRPDHFKIRVVNMAAKVSTQFQDVEDVAFPLTLAWADGTAVSSATSAIAPGTWSEYIELPYGAYQFKLLTPAGIQVTGYGGSRTEGVELVDPATSTLVKGATGRPHTVSINLTYAPIRTYQPGGIYTIVVSPQLFPTPYYNGNPGEEVSMDQNGFQVISDISEPLNSTYTRVQGVNALPGTGTVSITANGKVLGGPLNYATAGGYERLIAENVRFRAQDASGTLLAEKEVPLIAGQNYTTWLYRDGSGKAVLSVVANNLSGTIQYPGADGQDGAYANGSRSYPFDIRFLNFCAEIPYATFTLNNGQSFYSGISENIQSGVIPVMGHPYVAIQQSSAAYQVMLYQSAPGIVPGKWLSDIPVVKSTDLIARKELYVRGPLPEHEPGIYTIALIGRYGAAVPAEQKAKMIIVKHIK